MKLIIAKIDKKIFEGDFESVILPGSNGELEIFPGHAPLLSSLQKGNIIYNVDGKKNSIDVDKGFVEVNKKEVIVVL